MYRASQFTKPGYKTGEVAKILNVTNKTIQNYDKRGILKVGRTTGDRRLITKDDLLEFLDNRGLLLDDTVSARRDVIYARVSSHDQKEHGDLDRQALFLVENVQGLVDPLILKEVGSGLNDKRKQLLRLLAMVGEDQVRNVYITYKDRLTRFGYNYIETMFAAHGTHIIPLHDQDEAKSSYAELVEDMTSLMASFSGKLYGMRSRTTKETP